jgi:hypothetical protein
MNQTDINRTKLNQDELKNLLLLEQNYIDANEQFKKSKLYELKKQYERTDKDRNKHLTQDDYKLKNGCGYLKKFFYDTQNFKFLHNEQGVKEVLEYILLRKKAITHLEQLAQNNKRLISLYPNESDPNESGNFTRVQDATRYYATSENCDNSDLYDSAFYSDVEETYKSILETYQSILRNLEAPLEPVLRDPLPKEGGSKSRRTRRRKHRHNRKTHHKHARKTHHKRAHHSRSHSRAARKHKKYTYRSRK